MNRYETTFTLTVSIVAEDEERADQESTRRQIKLLEANPWIKYLEPSEDFDCVALSRRGSR